MSQFGLHRSPNFQGFFDQFILSLVQVLAHLAVSIKKLTFLSIASYQIQIRIDDLYFVFLACAAFLH